MPSIQSNIPKHATTPTNEIKIIDLTGAPTDSPLLQKSVDEIAEEFRKMGITHVLYKIMEKNIENQWEERTILVKLRDHTYASQKIRSHEKADSYTRDGYIVLLSINVFAAMGQAYAGPQASLSALLFGGLSQATDGTRKVWEDLRNAKVTIFDHELQCFNLDANQLTTDIQQHDQQRTRCGEQLTQMANSAHQVATKGF